MKLIVQFTTLIIQIYPNDGHMLLISEPCGFFDNVFILMSVYNISWFFIWFSTKKKQDGEQKNSSALWHSF